MLAVIPLMLLIFFAVFQLYEVSVREQSRGDSRVRGIVGQKNGLERMSRELRDSVAVKYQSSEVIDAQISVRRVAGSATTARGGAASATRAPTQGAFDPGPVTLISNVQSAEFHTLSNSGGALVPDYVNPTYRDGDPESEHQGRRQPDRPERRVQPAKPHDQPQ